MGQDPPELEEGQILLDRYSIIDRIDSGGMATIYRARDDRLDRVVCVKLLRNVIQDMEGSGHGILYQATYSHFLQEARALSKLVHPNTLRIYDFGFVEIPGDDAPALGPRPFHVSELLDGGNLAHYVRARGRLEPAEALAIIDRMASAVSEAHGMGVVHRDIKPSNILFARAGDALMPKLCDFGIAGRLHRFASGDTPEQLQVRDPIPLCSPRWAAPEQLVGHEEGVYTDVYALALVAAYMLSGRGLFDGPHPSSTIDARVADDAFVQGKLALAAFPAEATRVLLAALRADPRVRTQAPSEFYEQLARAFSGQRQGTHGPHHSGQVPVLASPRPKLESITLEVPACEFPEALSVEPEEQRVAMRGREARIVETHERLDLTSPVAGGADVRFRMTFLPGAGLSFRVNLKGLNCFVARPGSTPSPAVVLLADVDGEADLVSLRREPLAKLTWTFGNVREDARVFWTRGTELVVPFPRGTYALAVDLGADRDFIVVCRRS